jgi:glycosyltransferase involved in cell wall biosynthesis
MPETILHILPGLRAGGAEQVLRMIVTNPRTRFHHHVVSLGGYGQLGRGLQGAGIPVTALDARRIRHGPRTLMRLRKVFQQSRPGVIHAWLYHGIAAAILLPPWRTPIVGAIHATHLEMEHLHLGTRSAIATARLGLKLCKEAVFCSRSALDYHQESGFRIGKHRVIENGIDLSLFNKERFGREEARARLGLPLEATLIGMAARFDPQKDHSTLLAAVSQIRNSGISTRLVLAGRGTDSSNGALLALVTQHLDPTDVILLGYRNEMPEFYRALDVAILSSSYGEAWPLSVGEAMAMGCPVIATDVGDTGAILQGTGSLVPPRSPEALAAAILEVLNASPENLAPRLAAARERIEAEYSSAAMLDKYEALYEEMLQSRA